MGISAGPKIATDGLVYALDFYNPKSYSGAGLSVNNLLGGTAGTTYNGAIYDPANGGTFYFDGVNDYIGTGSSTFLTGARFSVSYWVNVSTFGPNYSSNVLARRFTLFGTVASYQGFTNTFVGGIDVDGSGNTIAVVRENNYSLNKWYHYAATFEGASTGNTNKLKIYIDGVQKSVVFDGTVPSSPAQSNTETTIGKFTLSNAFNYFNGRVSDLKIYDRELTAQEIQANYNATKKRFYPEENYVKKNLILHLDAANQLSYPGTGSTWYDLSGFGHSCGLINGPTFKPIKGGVISFDGSNDRAVVTRDTTKPLFTNSDFTLHCIFKYKNIDNSLHRIAGFADIENCLDCWITTNGTPTYLGQNIRSCFDDDSSGSRVFSTGTFEHIEFVDLVYSSTSSGKKLYINGGLNRTALTQSPVTSNYSFYIGSQESGSYFTNMEISLLQVYNRELTQAEVTQNYNAFRNRFEKPSAISDSLLLDFDFAKQYSYTGTGNTMYNLSGLGYTATLLNSPTYSSASPGYMSFDGTNDYVESSTFSGVGNTYFTLNIWFYKPTSWANAYRKLAIIGTSHFTSLYMSEGPGPVFYFGIGLSGSGQIGPETTKMPAVDQWHMATGTWDGSNVKLYIDGALISSVTGSGSYPSTWDTSTFKIGYGYGSEYFTGYISQVQLYNRALSAAEVLQQFNATRTRYGL